MHSVMQALSSGAITGTGTLTLTATESRRFGGGRLIADGTNTGTVLIYDGTSASDPLIFELSSALTMADYAPILNTSGSLYYSISGTGASFQPYEWIQLPMY